MSLLNWFKPVTQAPAESQPAESQDSSHNTTTEGAGIEQPTISLSVALGLSESQDSSHTDYPGESIDITDECIGHTPSFSSESDEQHHPHTLPPQPKQLKLKFPKRTFGKQKRSFSDAWYESFPWLHYIQEDDAVLCFYCTRAVQRKLPLGGYVEKSFTETGFNNWQKALHKFSKHEQSACHRAAFDIIMISKTSKAVDEMLCTSLAKEKADNRKAMLTIISTIRFLAHQGLPLRGSYVSSDGCETNSNFLQLLHLRKEDIPTLNTWLQRSHDRYTSPSIQNELLEIMATMILRKITRSLSGKLFSIMVDETSDISNTEQLVFCLRYVDEDLTTHEEFIGLYDMDCTTAENITRVIQDVPLRLSLQMSNCRGQCYDGAGSMAGCRTGVATTIQQQEPRALYTHCYGHALNLAVQDYVKNNSILRDALDTV